MIGVNVTARSCLLALPMCLAVLTASGCAQPISGQAQPVPGFRQTEARPQPQRTSATSDQPRIPAPRKVAGVDPCGLLTPQDLGSVGGAIGPPHPNNPLAGTCSHLVGGGPEDSAGAGFHVAYQQAVAKQPRGVAVDVEGHSAWLYCEVVEAYQTCTATTAVRADQSLLVLLSKRDRSAADTADALFRLTRAALRKLPSS